MFDSFVLAQSFILNFIVVSSPTLYLELRRRFSKLSNEIFKTGEPTEILVVPEQKFDDYDPDWVFSSIEWLERSNDYAVIFMQDDNLSLQTFENIMLTALDYPKAGCIYTDNLDHLYFRRNVFLTEYENGKNFEYLLKKLEQLGYKNYQINKEEN